MLERKRVLGGRGCLRGKECLEEERHGPCSGGVREESLTYLPPPPLGEVRAGPFALEDGEGCLGRISASLPHLGCISATSRLHLCRISAASLLHRGP